jgi:hypothetical protein
MTINAPWTARMITANRDMDRAPLLRRAFTLTEDHGEVRAATLRITAYGICEAWINDEPASTDLLTPGWSAYEWRLRYAEWDVTGLDFNSRFYADDDLIVGAADPFQLFRIMYEVIRGGGFGPDSSVAFMLDQCHNVEAKIPGQIRSVLNVQEMTARALLVDTVALAKAQESENVLEANGILMDAFYTDVRGPLAEWRAARGLPADPVRTYAESNYQRQIEHDRADGRAAGWGA